MPKAPNHTLPPPSTTDPADQLILPDESDQIITELRTQLAALQGKLDSYRSGGEDGSPPERSPRAKANGQSVPEIRWDDDFAPQVISRLHGPSQELTARLDRVIEQMEDPILREELERCRQTAYYLFETFRQISDHHRLLLDSIAEDQQSQGFGKFREQLSREFSASGTAIPVEAHPELPPDAVLPLSAVVVTATVARIAAQLIGEVVRVEVAPASAAAAPHSTDGEKAGATEAAGGRDAVCITLACTGIREGLASMQNAAQVVFRPGVSAITVVDWLYMEKIVELQGGSLSLFHEHGQAKGFQVALPG